MAWKNSRIKQQQQQREAVESDRCMPLLVEALEAKLEDARAAKQVSG